MDSPDRFRDNRDEVFQARRLDDMRLVDRERILRHGEVGDSLRDYRSKPASPRPSFPVPNRISRSHDMAGPPVMDPGLIHTFSQSRLDPPLSQTRNGLNSLSERFDQNVVRQGHDQFQPTRSFSGIGSPPQNRSPFQYIERPIPPREEHRQASYYNHHDPQPEQRQIPQYQTRGPPAHGENPLPYARAMQPRQIIVLE